VTVAQIVVTQVEDIVTPGKIHCCSKLLAQEIQKVNELPK